MDETRAETDRSEPSACLPNATGLGPAAAPDDGASTTLRLFKLMASSAVMAMSSALAGLLIVAALNTIFDRTAWLGTELKIWAATAVGQVFLGVFALWRASKRFGANWRAAMGLRLPVLGMSLASRIASALAIYWCWAVLIFSLIGSFGVMRFLELAPPDGPAFAMFALTAIVVAPVCEEAFFRGYVQGQAQVFLSPLMAIFAPAILFALAHFGSGLGQSAAVFMLGVLTGRLRRESGSLLPGMALHAVSNGCIVVLLALAR